MANEEYVALLGQGVDAWNSWRNENPEIASDLGGANLSRANLRGVDLSNAFLRGADLSAADLRGANLSRANLITANLRGATLYSADLSNADLSDAILRNGLLGRTILSGANLSRADLTAANVRWANASDANLSRVDLTDAFLGGANLSAADLRDADLNRANLMGTILSEADLRDTDLNNANLSRANLRGADLRGASLTATNLSDANLSGANLSEAYLAAVNLTEANLEGTDFTNTSIEQTVFGNVDLKDSKGLETCLHFYPSVIDHRTLERSGPLPAVFLRGCGLPDNLIDYLPSLLNQPIQFYSCFISYSSRDDDFAKRLHADLQNKGVRCWFAPEDMKIGDKIRRRIDEVIRVHEKLLLVLSESSIDSAWVEKEVETAFERERETKETVLFPVRLDDAVMDCKAGWAADIKRTRHIGDFGAWKDHDAYQKSLERLFRDLKAEPEGTVA